MRIFIVVVTLIFSSWLMWHTFSYDAKTSSMLISDKVWSDFGGHLPLVRSFSLGANWPPENPLFPGERIRYHFLFYALVGFLERIGLRIDWAMNIPSVLGFWGLLILIYALAKKLFASSWAGILAIILFVFNGSLSWVQFFLKHGWTWAAVKQITSNGSYPSFGPWDGGQIAAAWNLNLYTNQRHLAPGMALALLVIYIINFRKIHPVFLGVIIGFLIFLNGAIFAGLGIFLLWHFIFNKKDWKYLIISGLCTLPWFALSRLLISANNNIVFKPGFLMNDQLTVLNFINFWWQNLGLYLILLPLALIVIPKNLLKLIFPVLTLFAIVNLWQLSPDIFNNHKLLNLDMTIMVIMVAGLLLKLWSHKFTKLLVPIFLFFLIISGVIDFFALKNDHKLTLTDKTNSDIVFVQEHIPAQAVVLNSTWFYHPASLAGRPIYNGYTYFTWSHGYDSYGRENILKNIYEASSKNIACTLLKENNISYVELANQPEGYIHPDWVQWAGWKIDYQSSERRFFSVEKNCS